MKWRMDDILTGMVHTGYIFYLTSMEIDVFVF
jgi:hypothetical protein